MSKRRVSLETLDAWRYRLKRLTYLAVFSKYNAPGISEMKGQRFTVQLLVWFSNKLKRMTNKSEYNAVNTKRRNLFLSEVNYNGRSELMKTNTVCTTHCRHDIYISHYLNYRMEFFLYKKTLIEHYEKNDKQTWSKEEMAHISSMNECHKIDTSSRGRKTVDRSRKRWTTLLYEHDQEKMNNALRRQERMITNHHVS